MNPRLFFRPSSLLAMLFVELFTACRPSSSEPVPTMELAARVSGQYTFTELTVEGKTYPASETNLKGRVRINRRTAKTFSLQLTINRKSTGEAYVVDSVDNVTILETGDGSIDYHLDGDIIARSHGKTLSVDGEHASGAKFTIRATK